MKEYCFNFVKLLGVKEENLRIREHSQKELSHYSVATSDIEYLYPFGWGELWGIADRTDFDLLSHTNHSKEKIRLSGPTY